jgi:uncharacterized protein YkwD
MFSILHRLFARKATSPVSASSPSFRPRLEGLEDRTALSVTPTLTGNILTVMGTAAADSIAVTQTGTTIQVAGRSFAAASVARIVILGESGNDTINVSTAITKPTTIYGGFGDDTIYGGSGADEIYGGSGNDRLYGRNGNDAIFGGLGTDIVDGGTGTNGVYQGSPIRSRAESLMTAMEREIIRLVNVERTSRGLAALQFNGSLYLAADIHSQNMATRSNAVGFAAMQHTLIGNTTPTMVSRTDYAGYDFRSIRENIAAGYTSAASVVSGWMNSAGHRANILAADITHIGVSVRANAAGQLYFTQNFGARLS